ncbi:MAG: 4Fe-4S ferredoxin [Spirochaetes bacterium]|nr:MAG: 4Fe-4S ferredoxin [Spirochaetota bacterium]
MRKPKLRELGEAVKALTTRAYTIKFPFEPSEPFEAFRGKPEYSDEYCVGCGACANVCPPGAIDILDDIQEKKRRLILHLDNCIYCGQCELNCITEKGIKLTREYDLATLDRSTLVEKVEKNLLLCELCGAVIGTEEHVRWVAERLGTAAFSNPTVMLVAMKELSVVREEKAEKSEVTDRADRLRVLCPRCRKETTVNF